MGGKNYGVSKNLTIYDYRVCQYSEYSTPSSESDTICYSNLILIALHMIADKLESLPNRRGVVNLSLGGGRAFFGELLIDHYFNQMIKSGGIVTLSAGNSDDDSCLYSPAYPSSALTVGAGDSSLTMASFSNWCPCVDIWAPAVDVVSSVADSDSSYSSYSGSSMAAPHMRGFVANLLLVDPSLTYNEVKGLLQGSQYTNMSVAITDNECNPNYNGYTCTFPLYSCDTLPRDYGGFDCVKTTEDPIYDYVRDGEMPISEKYGEYSQFIEYECNTVVVASMRDVPYGIDVLATLYEATDVCSTLKASDDIVMSWAYVCLDSHD